VKEHREGGNKMDSEAEETLELERHIKAEAERCAHAIKLLGAGELRYMPQGMDSSALLACFLMELERQCTNIGAAARIVFCFYPMTPDELRAQLGAELRTAKPASDDPAPTAVESVH
jgi:cobyrinic acid a,c-diamide synthase